MYNIYGVQVLIDYFKYMNLIFFFIIRKLKIDSAIIFKNPISKTLWGKKGYWREHTFMHNYGGVYVKNVIYAYDHNAIYYSS